MPRDAPYPHIWIANLDGLTEIYNHRYFQELLAHEAKRLERTDTCWLAASDLGPAQKMQCFGPVELHDGGSIMLRKLDEDYDPTNRASAMEKILESHSYRNRKPRNGTPQI